MLYLPLYLLSGILSTLLDALSNLLIFISVKISHWLHWVLDLLLYQVLWSSDPSNLSELDVPSNERCSMFHLIYLMSDKILNTLSIFLSIESYAIHTLCWMLYLPLYLIFYLLYTFWSFTKCSNHYQSPLKSHILSFFDSTGSSICCSIFYLFYWKFYLMFNSTFTVSVFFFYLMNLEYIFHGMFYLTCYLLCVMTDQTSYALLDIKPFEVRSKYRI